MKDESVLGRTYCNSDSIACFKMQEKATKPTFNTVALAFSLAFWWSFMVMMWKNVALLALSLCDPLWKIVCASLCMCYI